MARASWEAAELGRLLDTHRIDEALITDILDAGDDERVALLLNILVRLEVRCHGDSAAIAAALERPAALLDGASIAERLRQARDPAALRMLREAAAEVSVPRVKMWRIADRYS